jgi:hypothetical protein
MNRLTNLIAQAADVLVGQQSKEDEFETLFISEQDSVSSMKTPHLSRNLLGYGQKLCNYITYTNVYKCTCVSEVEV